MDSDNPPCTMRVQLPIFCCCHILTSQVASLPLQSVIKRLQTSGFCAAMDTLIDQDAVANEVAIFRRENYTKGNDTNVFCFILFFLLSLFCVHLIPFLDVITLTPIHISYTRFLVCFLFLLQTVCSSHTRDYSSTPKSTL